MQQADSPIVRHSPAAPPLPAVRRREPHCGRGPDCRVAATSAANSGSAISHGISSVSSRNTLSNSRGTNATSPSLAAHVDPPSRGSRGSASNRVGRGSAPSCHQSSVRSGTCLIPLSQRPRNSSRTISRNPGTSGLPPAPTSPTRGCPAAINVAASHVRARGLDGQRHRNPAVGNRRCGRCEAELPIRATAHRQDRDVSDVRHNGSSSPSPSCTIQNASAHHRPPVGVAGMVLRHELAASPARNAGVLGRRRLSLAAIPSQGGPHRCISSSTVFSAQWITPRLQVRRKCLEANTTLGGNSRSIQCLGGWDDRKLCHLTKAT